MLLTSTRNKIKQYKSQQKNKHSKQSLSLKTLTAHRKRLLVTVCVIVYFSVCVLYSQKDKLSVTKHS